MNCVPLPEVLVIGQRIVQPRYADDEILEVFKVDADTGRVWLMRENGNAVTEPLTMETLQNWDYELVIEEEK